MRSIVAILSLLLVALLATAWVHGRGDPDVLVGFGPGGRPVAVAVRSGVVYVVVANAVLGPDEAWTGLHLRPSAESFEELSASEANGADFHHGRHGWMLAWDRHAGRLGGPAVAVSVPAWAAVPIALSPAAWWVRGVRVARRRRRQGRCRSCGYDLRGSPSSGRCPECGEPVGPAVSSGGHP